MQENVSRECKKSLRWVHTQNFTFTDSVQSLSLHFVFVSQGHGVKRGTAQDGRALLRTAGYLSSWATNTDKVQTPSALSALLPGAYRLGTYTYTKGTNTKKLGLKQRGRTHVVTVYTHIIDVKAPKNLWHRNALKRPWLQSPTASSSQRVWEAAGNRYTGNQWITQLHTHALRHCWWQSAPFALKSDKTSVL